MRLISLTYVIICLYILFIAYRYSNIQIFKYQAAIHIISMFFVYLITIKRTNFGFLYNKHICSKKKQTLNTNKINCLQNVCEKSGNQNECEIYRRCKWDKDASKCVKKAVQCDDIKTKDECTLDCMWENDSCKWKKNSKITNEKRKLNKYCFKRTTPPLKNFEDRSTHFEYNEDYDHMKCLDRNDKNLCIQKSKMKLECESSEGYNFNFKTNNCKRVFNASEKKKKNKIDVIETQHSHTLDQVPDDIHGYKASVLFKANTDTFLKNFFIYLCVFIVVIANFGLFVQFRKK